MQPLLFVRISQRLSTLMLLCQYLNLAVYIIFKLNFISSITNQISAIRHYRRIYNFSRHLYFTGILWLSQIQNKFNKRILARLRGTQKSTKGGYRKFRGRNSEWNAGKFECKYELGVEGEGSESGWGKRVLYDGS